MIKKIICLGFILIMLISLSACTQEASSFSEEEHSERISNLVEKRYLNNNEEYTGYKVYPLYNESDELAYFLIELEPSGFVYVKINKTSSLQQLFGGVSMYTRSEGKTWQRYKICEKGKEPLPYEGRQWKIEEADDYGRIYYPNRRWEIDEDGDFIYYDISHFKVASIENEKRYLLRIKQEGSTYTIPAVKRGEKYLNLVSMEEMEYEYEIASEKYSYAYISFFCKKEYDL